MANRYLHKVLDIIVCASFYTQYVKLPSSETPLEICDNPKLFPYFDRCLGAVDGSHIDTHVPSTLAPRYHNQKGWLSQNALAACGFDLRFVYALPGWEGSAADGQVFSDARSTDCEIPTGCFYLGDAGFALSDSLLIPYHVVCYHLREWALAPERPQTKEELFNLRHSQA
jgi:hypothetical protein